MATNTLPATSPARPFTRRQRAVDAATLALSAPVAGPAEEVAVAVAPPAADPARSSTGGERLPSAPLTGETIEVSTFAAMRGSTLVAGLVLLMVAAMLLLAGHAMQFDNWPADPSPAAPDRALDLGPEPGFDLAVPAPDRSGAELIHRRDRRSARDVAARLEARGDAPGADPGRRARVRTRGPVAGERPPPGGSGRLTAPPGTETAPLTGTGTSGGSVAAPAPAPPSPAGQPGPGSPAAQPGG